jgi:Tol biopolymer transport system component
MLAPVRRSLTVGAGIAVAVVLIGQGAAAPDASLQGAIVFERVVGPVPQLYVVAADGSVARRLTRSREWNRRPSVAVDGKRIAFARSGRSGFDIWTMSADGKRQARLVRDGFESSWSPDGSLYFTRGDVTCGAVFAVRPGGGVARQVTRPRTGDGHADPDVSRDGSRIAFSLQDCGQDTCRCFVRVVDVNGRPTSDLAGHRVRGNAPTWSPDGKRIAFDTWQIDLDSPGIYAINTNGAGRRRITPSGLAATDPAWSPDGRWIAFIGSRRSTPSRRSVYVIRPNGTGIRRLALGDFSPAWLP